ncbi:MAG: hypothetical protein SCARUB_04529 [Candidatus Scalindua rubra]|uniref:Uncharacterized protein n=1 Tax=Candidatus Scalindua rubra TaxID=1872076 RepID=A0A1E3X3Y6_9BACT|nr:MAG: hypothetical protein SCARUB_04529 [Candidatus Scalindua rubra]
MMELYIKWQWAVAVNRMMHVTITDPGTGQ